MLHWVLIATATIAGAAPPADWRTSEHLKAAEYVRKLGGVGVSFRWSPGGRLETSLRFREGFNGLRPEALPHLRALPRLREVIDYRYVHIEDNRRWCRSIDRDLALLASCSTIERVEIRNEELTQAGLLQLQRFKGLRHLSLLLCERTDADLPLIGQLRGLRSLDLLGNRLTGRTFHALAGLTNLRRLTLCGNSDADAGQLAHLRHLPLTDLDLALTRMTDANSLVLACFPRLERLCVRDTSVSDEFVRVFRHLPRLTAVNISGTEIGDRGVQALLRLPRIAEIDVSRLRLTDASARAFAGCPTLIGLTAVQCEFSSAEWFLALTGSRSLRCLSLAHTRLTDADMRALVRMPSLRELNVFGCEVTGGEVKDLRRARPGFRLDL